MLVKVMKPIAGITQPQVRRRNQDYLFDKFFMCYSPSLFLKVQIGFNIVEDKEALLLIKFIKVERALRVIDLFL